jgi:hypothetical protein
MLVASQQLSLKPLDGSFKVSVMREFKKKAK